MDLRAYRELSFFFFPLLLWLHLFTPQKLVPRTFVEPEAEESLVGDVWGVCAQVARGKPEHLAGHSQPGLQKVLRDLV